MKTQEEYKAEGFTIDSSCYPWVAYKGPRLASTESHHCLTDLEAELATALEMATDPGSGSKDARKILAVCRATLKKARQK